MFENHSLNKKIIYATALVIIVSIIYLANVLPSTDYKLLQGELIDLNQGWTVEYEGIVKENVTFPADLKLEPNTPYTARLIIPLDIEDHIRLRIRSSMQDVIVYVDGEEIFRDIKDVNGKLVVPDASLWHIFELPNNIGGKELKLEMVSPTRAFSGTLNEVYAGQGKDLMYNMVKGNIFNLSISVLMFIFGILTIGLSFFLKNVGDNRLLHLGLFAVSVSIWIFSESKLLQLLSGNRFILGSLSYILVAIIPMVFSLYLKEAIISKYKDIMVVFSVMFFISLILNMFLQLSGTANFITSIQTTLVLMALALISSILFLILEWKQEGNPQAKNMLMYTSILSVFLAIELYNFFAGNYEVTSFYSSIGILLFFVLITLNTFKGLNQILLVEKETEILKKLAFKDFLTNGGNRAAFERYIDKVGVEGNQRPFRLVMMDINNLKNINDNFGHKEGDKAIIQCNEVIEEHFKPFGECFRIGGDEFACILFDMDDEKYSSQLSKLKLSLDKLTNEQDYKLEIAIGTNVYEHHDNQDLREFIHNTDLRMYSNKKAMKST